MKKRIRPFFYGLALFVVPGVLLLTGCETTGSSTGSTNTSTSSGQSTSGGTTSGGVAAPTTSSTSSSGNSGGVIGLDGEIVGGTSSSNSSTSSSGGVSGSGSGADNALNMVSQGIVTPGEKRFNGQLNLTQYGGPTDGTPDALTKAGWGNHDNRLNSKSLALSPDLIKKYGLKGGEAISIKTSKGTIYLGNYDDTTGNKSEPNVIDIYDPGDRLGNDNFMGTIPPGQWDLVIG